MTLENKIVIFSSLGDLLSDKKSENMRLEWAARAKNENAWFTEDNVMLAIENISKCFLNEEKLRSFTKDLQKSNTPKVVGIVAAGNIPFVGLHDLLCVLLAGHKAMIKLSSSDSVLMKLFIGKLIEIEPKFEEQIIIAERLNAADAYIATGSDNSARYFEYYFGKKPSIIRKNRSSIAVLDGSESTMDLRNLGNDIFRYFGLGCRNVSKLYVPHGYKFDTFFEAIEYWNTIQIHHKYNNNYDYNKSIYLVNGDKHLDNGFLLLKEDQRLVSPLAVVFSEEYKNKTELDQKLGLYKDKIQCIVGHSYIPFGQSQTPQLKDYADGINTLEFLSSI
ncbi:MAG: acyl-CoA reductase [Cytophagales bacterium]|nr:acyl-CoA reductase [Cytophagales bacterium]